MPDNSRVRVDGFNRSVSQKVTWTAKKAAAEKETITVRERGGRNPQYTANREVIYGKEYLQKFRGVTRSEKGDNRVGEACRAAIKANNGKEDETIHILYSQSGKPAFKPIQLGKLGGSFEAPWKKEQGKRQKNSLREQEKKYNKYILVHNHPNSAAFSFTDFVALNYNPEIKTMIAAGHDGTVYILSVGKGKRLILPDKNSMEYILTQNEWDRHYRDLNGDLGAITKFCEKLGWDLNVR